MTSEFYDYIIVGSGFGGSVSAMRLAQKGYKILIIESGKNYENGNFPKSNWNLSRFLWMPKFFLYGIQRINLLRHVLVLSGAGVGGGSLVYANTLYVPKDQFFENETIKLIGGKENLLPYFELAKKMLGAQKNPNYTQVDELMYEVSKDLNVQDTFKLTDVGVYFGNCHEKSNDPYFGGEGPTRNACNLCGGCMVGCRFNAKNTLDKNYLYFAKQLGAEILPEYKVIDIIPLSVDGTAGYEIIALKTTSRFFKKYKKFKTKNLVISAGVLGTLELLLKIKNSGNFPNIPENLGVLVRTNSEVIVGASTSKPKFDYSSGIAITSSVHVNDFTHIEPVRYSKGSNAMYTLSTLLTDGHTFIPRQLLYFLNIIKNPFSFLKTILPIRYANRAILLLVMQSLDNSFKLVYKRLWYWPFCKMLSSRLNSEKKIPSYIPIANEFARRIASKIQGIPQSTINEVLFDIPTTAHILGGCCFGESQNSAVIDLKNRMFGYQNIIVCDGSVIPVNLGVNPSLTIIALTERVMAMIPCKTERHTFQFERNWGVTSILDVSLNNIQK